MKYLSWLLVLILIGVLIRGLFYLTQVNRDLDPDAYTYIALAKDLKAPFATYTREPLYIWLLKPLAQTTDLNHSIRVFSLVSSVLYLFLMSATWYRKLPKLSGLFFIGYLSLNNFLIMNSSRGLRTEWQMILMSSFLYMILFSRNDKWIILLATLNILLSFNTLIPVVMGIGLWTWKFKTGFKKYLIYVLLAFGPILPYLLYNNAIFHDPLYFWNLYGTWYRNYEYVEYRKIGCDGCPTTDQYYQNGYSGQPLTTQQYFLNFHGPVKVIKRTLRGMYYLYSIQGVAKQLTGSYNPWWIWTIRSTFFVGIAVCLRRNKLLIIIPAVLANLSAFFIPIDVDPRLWSTTITFTGLISAIGAEYTVKLFNKYVQIRVQK